MKLKIVMLVSIFLMLITMMGAISANGDIDNLTVKVDETEFISEGNVTLTFGDVQNQVDEIEENGTVELEGTYEGSGTPIQIQKSVTIQGKGEGATFDAKNMSSILNITANNVIIKNIKFINGKDTYNGYSLPYTGGSITWNGNNGQIINSSFQNSYVYQRGGAVLWEGNNLNIVNSTFNNCYGVSVDGSCPYGGSLFLEGTNVTIDACEFRINNATGADKSFGAAIYSHVNNLRIANSDFSELYSTYSAVYITDSEAIEILKCNFTNITSKANTDGSQGSLGIYNSNNINICNCSFTNNRVSRGSLGGYKGNGGSLYMYYSGNASIAYCTFINNSAQYGSSIYQRDTYYVTIHDSTFMGDSAYMGVISISSGNKTNIYNSTIANIESYGNSGIYFSNSPYTIIINVTFIGQTSTSSKRAIESSYTGNDNSEIINCTFSRNSNDISVGNEVLVIKKQVEFSKDEIEYEYASPEEVNIILKDKFTNQLLKENGVVVSITGEKNLTEYLGVNDNGQLPLHYLLNRLDAGLWNFTIVFYENDNYDVNKLIRVNITRAKTSVNVDDYEGYVNSVTSIVARVLNNNTNIYEGNVTFYLDDEFIGESKISSNNGGLYNFQITKLGNITLKAIYTGSKNFLPSNSTARFTISKIPITKFIVENINTVTYGEESFFKAVLTPYYGEIIEGTFTFYINGDEIGSNNVFAKTGYNDYTVNYTAIAPHAGENELFIEFSGNENYSDSNVTVKFNVLKRNTVISGSDAVFNKNDEKLIAVKLTDNNGKLLSNKTVSIKINEDIFDGVTNSSGIALINISALSGTYSIQSIFEGDINYNPSSSRNNLIVKYPTQIDINTVQEIFYGDKSTFNIQIIPESGEINEGVLKIYVDDVEFKSINLNSDSAIYECTLPKAGNYTLKVVYNNATYFEDSNKTLQIRVNKMPTTLISNDFVFNKTEDKVLTAKLTDKYGVELSKEIKFIIKNSQGNEVDINNLNSGNYTFIVIFEGDENYVASQSDEKRIIVRTPTVISIDAENLIYGKNSIFNINVVPESGNINEGIVKLYINNVEVNSSGVENGAVSFSQLLDSAGKFNISAVFYNSTYFEDSVKAIQVINKLPTVLTAEDFVFNQNDVKIISAKLTDVNGVELSKNITFIIKNSQNEIVEGTNLESGNYTFIAKFEGDEYYVGSQSDEKTIIVKINTHINIEDIVNPLSLNPITLKANVSDDKGNALNPNDLHYLINNLEVNGTYTPMTYGEYILTVIYNGDKYHGESTATLKFNVGDGRNSTVLTASDVVLVYNDVKYITAILKTADGKALAGSDVEITLNGVTKKLTTNAEGKVSLPVNQIPKIYNVKITFKGDTYNKPVTKEIKVTVKKATPKLTAKKKTFKAKVKTKKYTITLKTNKGKVMKKAKVTLKVNGKTYKATTNSKGKATFKIKKLTKKGTFKAQVRFAGDKYYNAVSKTVKIKVKK